MNEIRSKTNKNLAHKLRASGVAGVTVPLVARVVVYFAGFRARQIMASACASEVNLRLRWHVMRVARLLPPQVAQRLTHTTQHSAHESVGIRTIVARWQLDVLVEERVDVSANGDKSPGYEAHICLFDCRLSACLLGLLAGWLPGWLST
ncbi:unnamed protein product [Ceratitis capitata]|uniref:(Mediterranean fruit fly) hypothetical protein n=1 Tax=Ceratitis capitata TaxID=7213 RepID=A0A811V973_CERCA|nr:unnamed protein product [Ceratitis capitata]